MATALKHVESDDAARTLDQLAEEFVSSGTPPTVSHPKMLFESGKPGIERPLRAATPLIEKVGDLFAEPGVTHLAHCISADCKMGAGIAKTFVARFGPSSFRQRVAAMAPVVGCVVTLPTESGKTVYNLVTKENYYDKPVLPAVIEALMSMRSHARAKGVRRIAMPRIGCGLDGLRWTDVRQAIEYLFGQSGIQILIVDVDAPRYQRLGEAAFGETDVRDKKRTRVDEPALK